MATRLEAGENRSPRIKHREGRALQYGMGGEFTADNPEISDFCWKVLGLLPNISQYEPLVMLTSFLEERDSGVISRLTVRAGREERKVTVLPDIGSFQEYCEGNKVRGMIIIASCLGSNGISFTAENALGDFFRGIGKVADPNKYRVWIVDKDAADLPTEPKDEFSQKKLESKKNLIERMGLCDVRFYHPLGERIGWFTARPEKKRVVKEKDVSGDERIRFLREWMGYVIEYRGGKIISLAELEEKLRHSRSFLTSMQEVGDAMGIISQESCGCLVRTTLRGEVIEISKCTGEDCFRERASRDPKGSFELGKEYEIGSCGDCGGERTAKAHWVDLQSFDPERGISVKYKITCKGFDSHSRIDYSWVDPARILNPMYIYYCLHRRKKKSA